MKYVSRIASKQDTLAMVKALKQLGLTVNELKSGYECISESGTVIFKAMFGTKSYHWQISRSLHQIASYLK